MREYIYTYKVKQNAKNVFTPNNIYIVLIRKNSMKR